MTGLPRVVVYVDGRLVFAGTVDPARGDQLTIDHTPGQPAVLNCWATEALADIAAGIGGGDPTLDRATERMARAVRENRRARRHAKFQRLLGNDVPAPPKPRM